MRTIEPEASGRGDCGWVLSCSTAPPGQRAWQDLRRLLDVHPATIIPALHGLSPLEAVVLPAGREKVKALVDQIERDGPHMEPPLDPSIVLDLRQRLGLS